MRFVGNYLQVMAFVLGKRRRKRHISRAAWSWNILSWQLLNCPMPEEALMSELYLPALSSLSQSHYMCQQSQFFNQFCPENVSGNLIQVTYTTDRCNNRVLHVEEGMAFQLYNLYIFTANNLTGTSFQPLSIALAIKVQSRNSKLTSLMKHPELCIQSQIIR